MTSALSATYRNHHRSPALQACLSLRKLAKTALSPDHTLVLPPLPLDIPRPLSIDPHDTDPSKHTAKVHQITNDATKITKAKERALLDAKELIGEFVKTLSPMRLDITPPQPSTPPSIQTMTQASSTTVISTPLSPPLIHPAQNHAYLAVMFDTPSPSNLEISTPPMEPPSDRVCITTATCRPVGPPSPLDLVRTIRDILATPLPCPRPTQFAFHLDKQSIAHNTAILASHHFDLEAAISSDTGSPLQYGSEFRPTSILAPLLAHHPNWHKIDQILAHGSVFHALPLTEANRLLALDQALAFGNHKGAIKEARKLQSLLTEDVRHGFNLPVHMNIVQKIPGLVLSPMNIARQNTIDETGRIIEKDRLTHDHSFDFFPNSSINSRCDLSLHEPCMFGRALSRLVHWIVYLRGRFPTKRILLTKTDWKAAYRRGHLNIATALQCATQMENILLIPLRMTFGGAPCPSEWSCISDTGSDIATDIANTPDWDPTELVSPHQTRLPPVPDCDPARPPPRPATELLFDFPKEEDDLLCKFDNYIDDLIGAGVDTGPDSVQRLAAAGSLAIHVLARPVHQDEPIPRDDPNSLTKLAAEGLPEEEKLCLGLLLDTYRLLLSLPRHKYKAWSDEIRRILTRGKITFTELEQIIGRLENVCQIIHAGRHFLGRLRALLYSFELRRWGHRNLSPETQKDLKLWLSFLKRAAAGVSLNLLVFRPPTHVYRTDACIHGLGGYSNLGRAWRLAIPPELIGRAHINLLEFMGTIIGPWIDFLEGNLPELSSVFSQGDNTTATGWSHRSNFESEQRPVHLKVARRLGTLQLEAKIQLVNEWIAGDENTIADSLSRDTHLPSDVHVALLTAHFPSQMPVGFRLTPLPAAITSWVSSILRSLPEPSDACPRLTRSAIVSGRDGLPIWPLSTAATTHSSRNSTGTTSLPLLNRLSSEALHKLFDPVNCSDAERKAWLVQRCEVTWTHWYKPSGIIARKIPRSTPTADFHRFYRGKSPVTKAWTPGPTDKRPSA
jgi:hypothetical protein